MSCRFIWQRNPTKNMFRKSSKSAFEVTTERFGWPQKFQKVLTPENAKVSLIHLELLELLISL